MKREGPSFLARLFGRIAHPPSTDRCARCGGEGADREAQTRLEQQGLARVARWSALCPSCRRAELLRRADRGE